MRHANTATHSVTFCPTVTAVTAVTADVKNGPALRGYQVRALDACRAVIRAGKRRVLLVAPTGSGKTTIAAECIRSAIARGSRTLFLAHRRELLDQCHDRLLEFGVESGIIRADDPRMDPDQAVQVASVQTMVRRLERFAGDSFDLIIVDEAHHTRANTYAKILDHFSGARATLGLTATPIRADGRGLVESYDVLVEAASMRELVALGFLVPVRMYTSPTSLDLTGVHRSQGDYVLSELGERMNRETLVGNIVGEWQRLAGDRRTAIFATTAAHSQSIARRFVEAGIIAEHLDGTMDDDDRDAVLDRVRSGATQVITNCALLSEGWDQPEISCCVLARPTKSLGLYLQMSGRALRPAPGKTDCIILDHGNCFREHGGVGDRKWTLTIDKPKSDGEAPEKSCPGCGLIIPAGCSACPECGYVFASPRWSGQEKAVQLVDASDPDYRRDRFFEIVQDVSRRRRADGEPYKITAALVMFREQFGEWPAWSWQREAGIR
jgi:DNA repair protein RadD